MSEDAIEQFGERLVRHVRDEAIGDCDSRMDPDWKGPAARRWRVAAASAGGLLPSAMLIPDCVDDTISALLYAMGDADLLHLSYTTTSGQTVDWSVVGWGEPAGWYMGIPGWRSWYSKERIVDRDDLADFHPFGGEDNRDDPASILEELQMPRRAIEELGELLVRHVRDVAIQSCDMQLLPHSETPMAQRWRRIAAGFQGKVPPEALIPDCVDETIFAFLRAIDQGKLRLSFTADSGETVDLVKEGAGTLAKQYMASGGWRAKYSKERFFDDLADVASE